MQKDQGSVGSPIADVFSKRSYRVLPTLPRDLRSPPLLKNGNLDRSLDFIF